MGEADDDGGFGSLPDLEAIDSLAELGRGLRQLRRRARVSTGGKLTCRELAGQTGYGHSAINNWLEGRSLPSADRLGDLLIALDATSGEQRAFATARDRVEEGRRAPAATCFAAAGHDSAAGSAPVPRELPADVDAFTGRTAEFAELDGLLAAAGRDGPQGRTGSAVMISAVSGAPGVGKTALAVRWAHRVTSRFPDGQLFINLRGYDPDQPLPVGEALARFLGALGVPSQDIPLEVEERAARYRTLVHGRRMLVVLDNAASVEQVRPLLPGSGPAVVVTSRDSLAGLVARDGAHRLELDLLPARDAVALLRTLIGARVDDDPGAAAALAAACARLPLAVRVAAELAVARPAAPLAELTAELASEQDRLDLLDAGGDRRTAIRSVFTWSYRYLPPAAATMFRLLGLHPGPDWDRHAVAALTGTEPEKVGPLLGALTRAHLIQRRGAGRYGMHDLLRSYAVGLTSAKDCEDDRRAALTVLFDYYLATAAAAMDTLDPADQHRRPPSPPPGTGAPEVGQSSTALEWLDAERATLVAITVHAAHKGWPGHAIRLAATLYRYLLGGGHYTEAMTINAHALLAARACGDRAAQAHMLTSLGSVYRRQGHYQRAADHHQQALALAREIGDRLEQARAVGNLGNIYLRQGRYEQAADCLRQTLLLFRGIGDRTGEAIALDNLGAVCIGQGSYQQAASYQQQALDRYREIGDRNGEANALNNLGEVCQHQGRYQQAAGYHQLALDRYREIGDREGEAQTMVDLGTVSHRQGCYQRAAGYHQQALDLYREIGDRDGEAGALNGAGEGLLATGQPGQARARHAAALSLARQTGDRQEQARAMAGLGAVCYRQDRYQQAVDHHQQALDLYREIGNSGGEAGALNSIGETLLATGQPGQARACHAAALSLARQTGDRQEQARAQNDLALACHATGLIEQARRHWQDALILLTDLGVPDAAEVRARLADLD